jgi:hypothetical protein
MLHKLDYWQGARYRFGQSKGHYESWFLRANHPTRNEAFWIRYTIFSPHGQPSKAIGELWVIHSDGETKKIRAAKSEVPIVDCHFAPHGLKVKIGDATLKPGALQGEAKQDHRICWDISYVDGQASLLFLPDSLYEGSFPKAKAVVSRPHVLFNGALDIDGESIEIRDWIGSENHNWGSKHTDSYAWGQVVGFDNAPDAVLECATAKLRFGPLWTPPLTIAVLRVEGLDYKLNALARAFRADGRWKFFDWHFDTHDPKQGLRIHGRIHANGDDFVGLTYFNPPGGNHTCLNSKIAACEVTLERRGQAPLMLRSKRRAAFEILTDETGHGVSMVT